MRSHVEPTQTKEAQEQVLTPQMLVEPKGIENFGPGISVYRGESATGFNKGTEVSRKRTKPNFVVDVENFRLLQDELGVGNIVQLSQEDASLLAKHVEGHPDTMYLASSGVNLASEFGEFDAGEGQVAIEWVRFETRRKPKEPECNTYRYLFGLTPDGRCIGLDVTDRPRDRPGRRPLDNV